MTADTRSNPRRKVFIKTYGCQMNVYDSQRMGDALGASGYDMTETLEAADLVLLNTCHIREKAAEKVYSELGRLNKLKAERAAEGKGLMVGVAGCVAQAEGAEITRRAPVVDLVVGPQSYHHLPRLLDKARAGKTPVETEFPEDDKLDHIPAPRPQVVAARGPSAFLTVQEGCDKFCTFCVVPYTRGAEVSRAVTRILDEARALADAGVREITLLGQNVNAYHGRDHDGSTVNLASLLYRLAEVPGIARLRYTTSHPRDMDDDLIRAHRDLGALMPYLHLPVQSGSDRILAAMNRRHTRDDYLRLLDKIRAAVPDLALSGDFIVGFPGESEEDFCDTLSLVEASGYAHAYSFKYSPRPGTPGAGFADQVEPAIADERLQRLQALIDSQQQAFMTSRIGMTTSILLERPGRHPGQMVGRSPWLMPVAVPVDGHAIGDIITVTIDGVRVNTLTAIPSPGQAGIPKEAAL